MPFGKSRGYKGSRCMFSGMTPAGCVVASELLARVVLGIASIGPMSWGLEVFSTAPTCHRKEYIYTP